VSDMTRWGEDRIQRGALPGLRVTEVTVDAFTVPTDRWAELLAIKPGDRIRLTGFPVAILGFSSWDGWVVGGTEEHGLGQFKFSFKFDTALNGAGFYDDTAARYAANGDLKLNSAATSGATTINVASTGSTLSTTDVPYTIVIDQEQMVVTAVTSAPVQVATVTRGANGTTAAAHTSGSLVDIASPVYYSF